MILSLLDYIRILKAIMLLKILNKRYPTTNIKKIAKLCSMV